MCLTKIFPVVLRFLNFDGTPFKFIWNVDIFKTGTKCNGKEKEMINRKWNEKKKQKKKCRKMWVTFHTGKVNTNSRGFTIEKADKPRVGLDYTQSWSVEWMYAVIVRTARRQIFILDFDVFHLMGNKWTALNLHSIKNGFNLDYRD